MESCKELRENNPYLFNSWRAILYTEKGRKAGVVNDWRKFPVFYEDVHKSYKNGLRLSRKDKNKPYGMSYNGLLIRYLKNKNYTIEEILFGKKYKSKGKPREYNLYTRASKLLSAYKLKDWKADREFNLDRDWFVKNILKSQCIYCGSKEKLGCDRIDNSKGHTYDNVVPCCYVCNCARNNNFSFDEMKILGKTIKKIMEDRLSGNGN